MTVEMPSSIADGALGRKSVEQLIAGEFACDVSVLVPGFRHYEV